MGRPKKNKKGDSGERPDISLGISQETKNSIFGILSFIVAILVTLSYVDMAGSAGRFFHEDIARILFGYGKWIIPLTFAVLAVSFIRSVHKQIARSAIAGAILLALSALGLLFVIGQAEAGGQGQSWGGMLGYILGWPLYTYLDRWASYIILFALFVISVLMALDVPLLNLFRRADVEAEEEEKPKERDIEKLVVKKGNETIPATPAPVKVEQKPAKPAEEKEFVIRSFRKGSWTLPPLKLVNADQDQAATGDINASAAIIKRTLQNFGIDVEMGEVSIGPTVTQYTLRPAVGVKLSRISALSPDLSLALAAHPIRIEAPIPGKSLVGIEVPNKKVAIVGLRSMLELDDYQKSKGFLPLVLGRDVSGNAVFANLEKMPHILVAGATGTGKSVQINTILLSLLFKHSPDTLKMILVDPKRVELSLYNDIPHLITPVITDNKKVLGALRWAVSEMDRRYDLLSKAGSRDIFSYNTQMDEKEQPIMPFIVIVIDELADLMAAYGRDVEAAIVRLAQMSRAVGIHLILSTQRPSVEVITGLIKANITSRVALQVASQIDSRTILDMAGAEKLLGKGDMLFLSGDTAKPRRLQGPLVTEQEVKDVVGFLREQAKKLDLDSGDSAIQVDFNATPSANGGGMGGDDDVEDDMYEEAKQVVVEAGKASASLLQRRLRVGYARAARLLDILEEKGVIGPGEGAKPREVYAKADGIVSAGVGESIVHSGTPEAEENSAEGFLER